MRVNWPAVPFRRRPDFPGARLLHDRVASADRTLILYEGLYHEVFNEPERERVFADLETWLEARLGSPAVPSR